MPAVIYQISESTNELSFIGQELLNFYKLSGGGGVKQVQYVTGINKCAFPFTICRIRNLKQKAGHLELRTEPSDSRFNILVNKMSTLLKTTPHKSVGERPRYQIISDITITIPCLIQTQVCILLLDFCARHRLPIMNSVFQHKDVHKCTWQKGYSVMIDFVIILSDLWL